MASNPRLLLTGPPGSGKTTLVRALASELDPARILGFTTEEIRVGGERQGFRVSLLHEAREGLLAHVEPAAGPRLGRYRVDVEGFEGVVLPFLEAEVDLRKLYLLDEVGKMECFSKRFERAVTRLIESEAAMLATVPIRATGFSGWVRSRPEFVTFKLRAAEREAVGREILSLLSPWGKR